MIDRSSLLEAHVQFELTHWYGESLGKSVEQEVAALADWAGSKQLAEVVTPDQVMAWIQRNAVGSPLTDELSGTVSELVRAAHSALAQERLGVRELLPRPHFEQVVEAALGMVEIRRAVTGQVTSSAIYAELVSHLLYRGIKSFVLKENVLARRVPGASSLLRFGQHAISSTAPSLERGIDNQLASFIRTNIIETIKESQGYLQDLLDDPHLWAVAEEIWSTSSAQTVADTVTMLESGSLDDVITAGRDLWLHLRQTPVFTRIAEVMVTEFFRLHGARTVAALLADHGIPVPTVVAEVTAAVTPILAQARDNGFLEERIRLRLDGFYSAYFGVLATPPPPAAPKTAAKTAAKRAARKRVPAGPKRPPATGPAAGRSAS